MVNGPFRDITGTASEAELKKNKKNADMPCDHAVINLKMPMLELDMGLL